MGANIQNMDGGGPYCFKIQGQVYHRTGALHAEEGRDPVNAQLYIHDPEDANARRLARRENEGCLPHVMALLHDVLLRVSPFAANFQTMHEVEKAEAARAAVEGRLPLQVRMDIMRSHGLDARRYNTPAADEVAVIFVVDDGVVPSNRELLFTHVAVLCIASKT